jgi:hypothetical protein
MQGLIKFTNEPGKKSVIMIVDPEGKVSAVEKQRRRKIRMVVNHEREDET